MEILLKAIDEKSQKENKKTRNTGSKHSNVFQFVKYEIFYEWCAILLQVRKAMQDGELEEFCNLSIKELLRGNCLLDQQGRSSERSNCSENCTAFA